MFGMTEILKYKTEKIYKMQKRAARIITNSNYEIRTKDIFRSLKWIPIEFTLRKREILMTFKAILHNCARIH